MSRYCEINGDRILITYFSPNPNNFFAWSKKGQLLENLQRYEEALSSKLL